MSREKFMEVLDFDEDQMTTIEKKIPKTSQDASRYTPHEEWNMFLSKIANRPMLANNKESIKKLFLGLPDVLRLAHWIYSVSMRFGSEEESTISFLLNQIANFDKEPDNKILHFIAHDLSFDNSITNVVKKIEAGVKSDTSANNNLWKWLEINANEFEQSDLSIFFPPNDKVLLQAAGKEDKVMEEFKGNLSVADLRPPTPNWKKWFCCTK